MFRPLLILFLFLSVFSSAQKLPSIEDKTAGMKKLDGYLPGYWDENQGKFWLEINRIDTEMLYVTSLPAGLGSNDIGLDRGLLGAHHIIKFSKTGRKLMMTEPNYHYRAISKDYREKRAVEQSFAQSILWGFTIEAESSDRYLVDATDFLLRDAMQVANRIRSMRQGNYSIDKSRSAVYLPSTKNFPLNTELEATITFINSDGQAGNMVQTVTPSSEAITLRMHHSFVQLPDSDYEPRTFDARSSFIPVSFFDYATPVTEPIDKYFIIRHRLKKKDPSAIKSEAVKPIIYYLDNGTPEPIRSALLEGASWWNQAFEAAGYINAFQVKILPDDADPMDIRYNMINWVHRSTRGWSYGASVVDPRTGEIIKGQVSLGSLRVRQDYLIAQGLLSPFENGMPADNKMLKMALERLTQLAAHEVGHTLGLMHNYAASVVNRSSVMDYPPPSVYINNKGAIDLSDAYAKGIGAWDKVSIQWGYSDFAPGTDQKKELNQILSAAQKNGLLFISDRDARAAGGLHPYAHLWDNGKSPVEALQTAMRVRAKALAGFGIHSIPEGTPMAFLEDVLVPVYLYHRYQLEAVSKWVGGMDYTYAIKGDGQPVTRPLSTAEQKQALEAVLQCIDPKTLVLPSSIAALIPPRPAGYDFTRELFKKRTGLAFDALSPAETAADLPLSFLLNTERVNRMVVYQAMNNGLGLNEMLDILMGQTWKSPRRTGMEGLIQIQTEQIILTYLLSLSVDEEASYATRSIIAHTLATLKNLAEMKIKEGGSEVLKGHYILTLERMKKPELAKPSLIQGFLPPGAPIGSDDQP